MQDTMRFKGRYTNLAGQIIGCWHVVQLIDHDPRRREMVWLCECRDCGAERQRFTSYLRSAAYGCRACKDLKQRKVGWDYLMKTVAEKAVERGHVVDVGVDEIRSLYERQQGRCALTGLEIGFASSHREHHRGGSTASLDRIDPTLGYRPGNLQWVHKDINRMKSTLDQDRFILLCRAVAWGCS